MKLYNTSCLTLEMTSHVWVSQPVFDPNPDRSFQARHGTACRCLACVHPRCYTLAQSIPGSSKAHHAIPDVGMSESGVQHPEVAVSIRFSEEFSLDNLKSQKLTEQSSLCQLCCLLSPVPNSVLPNCRGQEQVKAGQANIGNTASWNTREADN